MDRIAAFANAHGLTVAERHSGRRLVSLSGPLRALEAAFGTELHMYDHPKGRLRARAGTLSAPAEVADVVEAVLGLDQRPVATPKSV